MLSGMNRAHQNNKKYSWRRMTCVIERKEFSLFSKFWLCVTAHSKNNVERQLFSTM